MVPVVELVPNALKKMADLVGSDGATELIQSFLKDLPLQFASLEIALQQSDWRQAERAFHNLKSSTAYIGAAEFSRLCGTLESAVRKGDPAVLHERQSEVLSRLRTIGEELRRLLAL